MARKINLGKVVGKDATINGVNQATFNSPDGSINVSTNTQTGTIGVSVANHASKHGTNGSDPIAPSDIGAATSADLSALSTSVGSSSDTASATGSAYARIKKNADDIAALNTSVGASSDSASATGSVYARIAATKAVADAALPEADLAGRLSNYQPTITGTPGQLVGFDPSGAAVPVSPSDVTNSYFEIYGFEIDQTESDPSEMVKYIADNALFKSAKMVCEGNDKSTWEFDYGDWKNAWFIKDLKVVEMARDASIVEEIDPDNYNWIKGSTSENPHLSSTVSVRAADGAYVSNPSGANVNNIMVGIPTVWIKIDVVKKSSNSSVVKTNDSSIERKDAPDAPERVRVYFAPYKVDDSWHAYAHTDHYGKLMDYTYLPAFGGSVLVNNTLIDINNGEVLRSIPYVMHTSVSRTTDNQRACAFNNFTGGVGNQANPWDIEVLADRQLISLLLILIGKSTNTQAVFGNGAVNRSNPINAGGGKVYKKTKTVEGETVDITDGMEWNASTEWKGVTSAEEDTSRSSEDLMTKGLFWGNTKADVDGVKVFGIENFWGNIWRRTCGYINASGRQLVKLTWGKEDGSNVEGYNTSGANYIDLGFNNTVDDEPRNNQYGVLYTQARIVTDQAMPLVQFAEYDEVTRVHTFGANDSATKDTNVTNTVSIPWISNNDYSASGPYYLWVGSNNLPYAGGATPANDGDKPVRVQAVSNGVPQWQDQANNIPAFATTTTYKVGDGYISSMMFNQYGMFALVANGSEATYYCDKLWYNNNQTNFALFGGRWGYYRDVGTLNCALHSPSSGTNTHIGASLSCKPRVQ